MKLGRFCIAVVAFSVLILALYTFPFHSSVAMDTSLSIDNETSNPVVSLGQTYGDGKLQPGLAIGIGGAGVEIGPDHSQQVYAGQIVMYSHVLTNTGTTTDTFSLEVLSMQHWPVNLLGGTYPTGTLILPLQVGAQMTVSFEVGLVVPLDSEGIVETTVITATSLADPMARDTAYNATVVLYRTFLPLVLKRWPPQPPNQPTLNLIDNADGNSLYILSWTEQPSRWADTYIVQEATDSAFTTGLRYACTTTQQSCAVNGRRYAGTYYLGLTQA